MAKKRRRTPPKCIKCGEERYGYGYLCYECANGWLEFVIHE